LPGRINDSADDYHQHGCDWKEAGQGLAEDAYRSNYRSCLRKCEADEEQRKRAKSDEYSPACA
jgi:hypothetical protein